MNRIQMDNGGDGLWWISPQTGPIGDPANGIVSGDMYWKVLPANASRQCDGVMEFLGIEVGIYDLDWDAGEELWGWMISSSRASTSGSLFPNFIYAPQPPAVYVPGLTSAVIFGNPKGPGGCPPPNYVSGWIYQDIVTDTAGNAFQLAADGSTDWSVTHLFPEGMDVSSPDPNSCGTVSDGYGGDYTYSWLGSHDDLVPGQGENQPDRFGSGKSQYGGYGTGGSFEAEDYNGGAELAFLIGDTATLQPYVDADAGLQSGTELGLAANTLGIGRDLTCTQIASPTIGAKVFDQMANPGDAAIFFANLGPSLLDLGLTCVPFAGSSLALNPSDPAFLTLVPWWGAPFAPEVAGQQFGGDYGGEIFDDVVATTIQLPVVLGCGSIGASLQIQGFRLSGSLLVSKTQIFTVSLSESGSIL